MAKKKKKATKRRGGRRRGRVSGIGMLPGIPVEAMAAIGAGAIASQALNGVAQNVQALQRNPKILPVAKILLGGFLVAKSRNPMMQNFGGGVIADGALQAARTFAPNVFKGFAGDNIGALIDLDSNVSGTSPAWAEEQAVAGYGYGGDVV